MVPPLSTRRLLQESAPVVVILLFWTVLSWLVRYDIAAGFVRAGVIMALLYTVVRGVSLARRTPTAPQPDDIEGLLRENVHVALPAGGWFLAAHLVYFIEGLWDLFGIPGVFTSPAADLSFVFIGAGVAVVLLYAISVGLPRVRGDVVDGTAGSSTATPAND